VEEDEATVVDTDDEDSPPGGRCFRCLGEECQWENIAVTTACVACNNTMCVMCGVKFDDGEGLDDGLVASATIATM